jgi:hypothetical protein
MGQFKPMVKMMTTEPSVELKLKKGGHAHKDMKKGGKAHHGHKPMHHMMDGGVLGALAAQPALVKAPARAVPAVARPAKPSMAARRAAMLARGPMKKGGKAHHAHGGAAEGKKNVDFLEKHHAPKAMVKEEKKEHGLKHGGKTHHKKFAKGGSAVAETTSGDYKTTKMHEAKTDATHGPTGDVKEGNAGGYKRGGHAHHMKHGGKMHHKATGGAIPSETTSDSYAETEMHEAKPDHAHGTGGIKEQNAGGFKHGGKAHHKHGGKHHKHGGHCYAEGGHAQWEFDNVDTSHPGVSNKTTGGVKESNAGGYKKGGHSKKAYATGGRVQDDGRAVAMPQGRKTPSTPVNITRLSGTFKKGGEVGNVGLEKVFDKENATGMKEAKAYSNEIYSQYGGKKRGGKASK